MDKALIVTILVPTLGPNGETRDEWHGAFGTGCAVHNDLILTSRHVIRPERRDRRFPIKVRWYDRRDPEDPRSAWVPLAGDDDGVIAWAGQGDLDAALIRCPRHTGLKAVADYRLPVHRPVGGSEWESRGFPLAGVIERQSHHGDFIGKVMSMALRDSLFNLSSQVKTDRPADWGGASGMPVIVGDEIVGVVKAVPDNYDNAVLQAVPTFRMRADEKFCRLLGCETAPDLLQTAHDLMVDLLKKSDSATRQLKRHLAPDCGDLAPCRKAIAAAALDKPLRELVEVALAVQRELQDGGDACGAELVAGFVQAVLPVGAEPFEIEKVRSLADGCTLIRLDAHSPTLAEIIMAGADRRGARFRVLRDRKAHPRGEGCLAALLPEGGRDPQGRQRERDFTTDILQIFESAFDDSLEDSFFGHLKCVLPEDWQNPGADLTDEERLRFDAGLVGKIREELRELARGRAGGSGRFTYYVVSEIPPNLSPPERDRREGILQRLKARFPEIVFLCMAPRPDFPWEELEPYGNLRSLLYTPRTRD